MVFQVLGICIELATAAATKRADLKRYSDLLLVFIFVPECLWSIVLFWCLGLPHKWFPEHALSIYLVCPVLLLILPISSMFMISFGFFWNYCYYYNDADHDKRYKYFLPSLQVGRATAGYWDLESFVWGKVLLTSFLLSLPCFAIDVVISKSACTSASPDCFDGKELAVAGAFFNFVALAGCLGCCVVQLSIVGRVSPVQVMSSI